MKATRILAAALCCSACGSPTQTPADVGSVDASALVDAGCDPETDSRLCERLGLNCGPVTAPDNCQVQRTVPSCGGCGSGCCGCGGTKNVCGSAGLDATVGSPDATAAPPDASVAADAGGCASQKECGDIVNEVVTKCCIGGECRAPGQATATGDIVTEQIYFDLDFKQTLTGATKPQSAILRFIYPKKVDGSPVTCADVIGSSAAGTKSCVDQSTRAILDGNLALNQVFRSIYALNFSGCTGTECLLSNMVASVPQGVDFILYGEAWYGPRELNNPTGQCAAYYCLAGQTVSANAHYTVVFQ